MGGCVTRARELTLTADSVDETLQPGQVKFYSFDVTQQWIDRKKDIVVRVHVSSGYEEKSRPRLTVKFSSAWGGLASVGQRLIHRLSVCCDPVVCRPVSLQSLATSVLCPRSRVSESAAEDLGERPLLLLSESVVRPLLPALSERARRRLHRVHAAR